MNKRHTDKQINRQTDKRTKGQKDKKTKRQKDKKDKKDKKTKDKDKYKDQQDSLILRRFCTLAKFFMNVQYCANYNDKGDQSRRGPIACSLILFLTEQPE